jgi:hypothetical protein
LKGFFAVTALACGIACVLFGASALVAIFNADYPRIAAHGVAYMLFRNWAKDALRESEPRAALADRARTTKEEEKHG